MQNLYKAFTGETLKIAVEVLNSDGSVADLNGVSAVFAYDKASDVFGASIETKDCTITDNVISIELEPDETLDTGEYKYEFRIKSSSTGEINSIERGRFKIYNSLLKNDI